MAESSLQRLSRPTLAAAAALLVLASALAAVLVLGLAQGRLLRQQAADGLAARAARLAEGGAAFLDRAETLARTAAEAVDQRFLSTDFGAGSRDTGAYLLLKAQLRSLYRLMGQHPFLLRASLADVRGDFWEVSGLADGSMRVKSVVRIADPHRCPEANASRGGDRDGTCVMAALMRGDVNGTITGSEPLPGETYDPRGEAWYLAVSGSKTPVFTAPVAEPATGRAAMLLAAPVIDAAGRFLGALALTLDLEDLSLLAEGLASGGQGRAFLAQPEGSLAAWSAEGGPVLPGPGGDPVTLADPARAGSPGAAKALALAAADSGSRPRSLDFDLDGAEWMAAVHPLPERPGRPALLALAAAPAAELAPAPFARPGVGAALALALLGAAAALVLGWLASQRLGVLRRDLDRLKDLDLESVPDRRFALRELDHLAADLAHVRDRLAAYRRFLPTPLVRTLVRSGAAAEGPAAAEATLLLARLDSPAGGGGRFRPADVLEAVEEAGRGLQGFSFATGEGRLGVIWNTPCEVADHPFLACQAALGLMRALDAARSKEAGSADPIPLRLGIHSGPVRAGVSGSRSLAAFGVDADSLATVERLAAVAAACGVGCVLSRPARELVRERTVTRVLDLVLLPGADRPAPVYELVAARGQASERTQEFIRLYESGLFRLVKGEAKEAAKLLLAAHKLRPRPDDASCTVLLKRCIAEGKKG
ncbi:MAG: cache domain-containing protein [Thermodesulfobacteriota bacterium]